MRRSSVALQDIAAWDNLATAFHAAARGKTGRPDVEAFRARLDDALSALQDDLLAGTYAPEPMRHFRIHDPKPRLIHAPSFRDRVAHHAIMACVGPVLDRTLVFDTYACRKGKGTLAAVQRAAAHAARFPWFCQIDIRAYFASIDHATLGALLRRQFRNAGVLTLLETIIGSFAASSGEGLPIGTLTSQHFANFYLSGLDRLVGESPPVRGLVRYMDDIVWWTQEKFAACTVLAAAEAFLADRLRLEIKSPARVGRSVNGLTFCGFRILPGRLLMSRRRKRLYSVRRAAAERDFAAGRIDAAGLQRAFDSVLSLTAHVEAAGWRRAQLARVPLAPSLAEF